MPRARSGPPPVIHDPSLSGLSQSTLTRLAKLGIASKFDLVLHLPLRYDDETRLYALSEAPAGEPVVVEGTVVQADVKYRPRRQLICHIEDGSGVLTLRFFNFYPSQLKSLAAGARVRAFGEIRHGFLGPEMTHPRYRVLHGEAPVAQALTPVYPTTANLRQEDLRRLIARALADCDLEDSLPPALVAELGLPAFREAVMLLHNPSPQVPQDALQRRRHPAWRRMKFDELLAQQLSMRLHYQRRKSAGAPALRPRGRLAQALLARLPFKLTAAQNRALAEIRHDLAQPYPMQRLLQGDVGSGKTIVAALAALQCVENGYQVAVMAPTEILSEQHYRKLAGWLAPLAVKVAWLSGGLARGEKRAALAAVAKGEAGIAVGTHALIEEEVEFSNLAFAIVDEQHRFGVHQRLALRMKGTRPNRGAQPHQLMMSATPIPRTLEMSFYADLDVSTIDELPPGRAPVATRLFSEARRAEVIRRVRDACMSGSQAYWVCPLVEESEQLQLKAALETHAVLTATFPELKLGLVHGRLKGEKKSQIMEAFRRGDIQLLVATTVIEVGVDIPNATLMVIEHAERMGLAQLHQLRGRIGRGAAKAECVLLFAEPLTPAARERLKIIFEHRDGFEVARYDLTLRGPGELLGARQSGAPLLRFADLTTDLDLLEQARAAAGALLREQPDAARAHVARWLGARHDYLKA
ncbi:MAG: ATP-dependent DNA helicase RecG [Burkholderiales bacterium]